MITEESEADLLERAEGEEKEYNWTEAVKLYESAVSSFVDKNMIKRAAETYKKLGYAYEEAAHTVDTTEKFIEFKNSSANAFTEATNMFKKIQNKPEELECEALALYIEGTIINSAVKAKKILSDSYELMMKANELYTRKSYQEGIIRTLNYAASIQIKISHCSSDLDELIKYNQICRELAKKCWKLSKKAQLVQFLAESLETEYNSLLLGDSFVRNIRKDESLKRYIWECFSRCEESLIYLKDCSDFKALSKICYAAGSCIFQVGYYLIMDENEQEEYFNKALDLFERAIIFSKKTKNKQLMIYSLYYLKLNALNARKIELLQKKISDDITEITNLGNIYTHQGYYSLVHGISNSLPTMYYSFIAQSSFFTPAQRTFYAAKGIEYAKITFNGFSSYNPTHPTLTWPLMALTFSYSTLTSLTPEKSKRAGYAQKMLQYANQTSKISEKFEGGFAKFPGYMCLYRAYKTLADIAESKEERIKMLSAAADVQKNYIPHALESHTGIIATKVRLGLLYEEIGIITGKMNPHA